ncbi:2-succinyl-6-hydroxy-2,4-cyclohexadiene-1-carboxylate synthase [Rosettibacter firmus]|uniref:2-succinyl-6-hydroxy-2, 4-cyclohexadiene-1-carboxylate synthase n=1 Tax=Rosettibacter firmus TaxID=3111522 RepID=UPI00336BBBEA
MKIKVDQIEFNILIDEKNYKEEKTPIIFLHGFTGCAEDWLFIFDKLPSEYYPIAIDLIGHGLTDSPDDPNYYTCRAIVNQLNYIFESLKIHKLILCGYSMGGRAALSYCLHYPQKIIASIFESTTAGIEDITIKKERVISDFLLAEKIREEGIESFIDYWMNNPLFKTQKEIPEYELIKKKKYKNSVIGLSNLLMGFSTGLMPSYWDKINQLEFPVLLITGSLDEKYTSISKRMKEKLKNAEHKIAESCGHNVHLEKPDVFIKFVLDFLNNKKRKQYELQLD